MKNLREEIDEGKVKGFFMHCRGNERTQRGSADPIFKKSFSFFAGFCLGHNTSMILGFRGEWGFELREIGQHEADAWTLSIESVAFEELNRWVTHVPWANTAKTNLLPIKISPKLNSNSYAFNAVLLCYCWDVTNSFLPTMSASNASPYQEYGLIAGLG